VKRALFATWHVVAGWTRPSKSANLRRLRTRQELPASFRIRDALPGDVSAIVNVHVKAWNHTYAPLLLRGPSAATREQQWRDAFIRNDPGWFCLVVERPDGEIVGFARGKPSDHPEYGGELNKIYLLPAYQHLGLGRRLLGHVARRFQSQGVSSMWLYGDARNPSSRVWLALGAVKTDDEPGNGNYGWHDLSTLASFDP